MNNLNVGRIYRVVRCREKILECKIHEAGAKAVEVVESDISAIIPQKLAMEGAVITYNRQECNAQECGNFEKCIPNGLLDEDRCLVVKVVRKVKCASARSLAEVVLQRIWAS